jgi:ADP-heptose:LPS heptosyltransferase
MIKEISDLKKILIVRLSSMGDILLTTPLIRSIKKQNPNIQIDYVIKTEFFDVLKHNHI